MKTKRNCTLFLRSINLQKKKLNIGKNTRNLVKHGNREDICRAATPEPVAALQALYAEPTQPEWLRLRVIDALARFPEPAAQAFLEARLDETAAQAVAGPAGHAAAAVYLRTFSKAATARLSALLSHPDPAFRVTVVRIALEAEALDLRTAIAAWLNVERRALFRP